MEKLQMLNHIADLYKNGENIISYLKNLKKQELNSLEDIMISYDFQSGSYIEHIKNNKDYIDNYTIALAKIIDSFGDCQSVLEAGVGEATTFGNVVSKLSVSPKNIYGFDISWSRIKYGYSYLKSIQVNNPMLVTGDLFCAPFKSNSIDVVYTSHSIEPNGGKEKEALSELYRITNNYLVLLEPSYELASEKAKQRMERLGYIRNLYKTAIDLGYKVEEYRLFDYCSNELNPTAIMIIAKNTNATNEITEHLACPTTKTHLTKSQNAYFSKESLLAYPIIGNIPCLLPSNAIVATHFNDELGL
jgi:ubiquinone/menaquinone biosynthesis C-methylase UbiE